MYYYVYMFGFNYYVDIGCVYYVLNGFGNLCCELFLNLKMMCVYVNDVGNFW